MQIGTKTLTVSTCVTLKVPKMEIVEFANRVNPDEASHDEPPHLDPHCFNFPSC